MFAFNKKRWYNDDMATDARKRAVKKYNAKTYERLYIRVKKEEYKDIIDAIGERSINSYVMDAIREKMEREKLHGDV